MSLSVAADEKKWLLAHLQKALYLAAHGLPLTMYLVRGKRVLRSFQPNRALNWIWQEPVAKLPLWRDLEHS